MSINQRNTGTRANQSIVKFKEWADSLDDEK